MDTIYDVIIIGSGPAGLTAAIYTSRAALKTLILAGRVWGGQLMLTTEVENFPGFPEGIMGPELMMQMRKQAERHGAEIKELDFKSSSFDKKPFELTTDDDQKFLARSVIVATGASTKWLDVPGEKEKIGRGVSSCAPCDAAFFRNRKVMVVGGGDSAMEEALVLSKFATHVYIVHRRDSFKASEIMQKKVFENPKITVIWNSAVEEIMGETNVKAVKLKTGFKNKDLRIKVRIENKEKEMTIEELGGKPFDSAQGKKSQDEIFWEFPIDGVFVAIGHIPNSKAFPGITTDEKGFIEVTDRTKSNIDGVFVAGDVNDRKYMQAITAAGLGCMAALDVERWLETQN